MHNRHWLLLLLLPILGALELGCLTAAQAQVSPPLSPAPDDWSPGPPPSHRLLENGPEEFGQAEAVIAERLRQAGEMHEMRQVQKLARDLLKNPAVLEELQGLYKNMPDEEKRRLAESARKALRGEKVTIDPHLLDHLAKPELLDHLANQGHIKPLDKNQVELLRKWASRPEPEPPPDNGQQTTDNGQWTTNEEPTHFPPQGSNPPGYRPRFQPPSWPKTSQRDNGSEGLSEFEQQSSAWLKSQVGEWVKSLEKEGDLPEGHPFREALRQLEHLDLRGEGAANKSLSRELAGISRFLPRGRLWSEQIAPFFRRFRLTPFSSMPQAPAMPSAPDLRAPDVGQSVLLVAVASTFGVLLWMSLAWSRNQGEGTAGAWKPGPWPVDPAAVSTRGQLVQAFEYLALLRLGRGARTRNHLDIAAQLAAQPGDDAPRRREAADRLARLYEQARYAPLTEQVPEEELAGARRDLCFLAGVASA